MKIFDGHVHVSPDMQLQDIIHPMDELNIDKALILGVDHGTFGDEHGYKVSNEFVGNFCAKSDGRLIGIGSIHPDRGAAIEPMMIDVYEKHSLRGIKLYPHAGFYVTNPFLNIAYEISLKNNGVVFIHAGIKAHRHQRMIFNNPIYIDEVAVKYPQLKIVICHCGYPWIDEAVLISRSNDNVWLDLTFLETLEAISGEPLLTIAMKKIVAQIGAQKVIWGSEGAELGLDLYPDDGLNRIRRSIDNIMKLDFIDTQAKEDILFHNLERLLN